MTETGYCSSFLHFRRLGKKQHGHGWKVRRFHLFTILLKLEIAHRGDHTSVRKTDICYRRKHTLCGLFKAVAVLGIERSLSVTVRLGQSVSLTHSVTVTVSHNSDSLTQSDRCSPTYQVTEI